MEVFTQRTKMAAKSIRTPRFGTCPVSENVYRCQIAKIDKMAKKKREVLELAGVYTVHSFAAAAGNA